MIEVIKLGAPWCGPCNVYDPIFDSIAEKHQNENSGILFKKVDIDNPENVSIVEMCAVRSIPTTVFIVSGEIKQKKIGVLSESDIEETLKSLN